MSSHLPLFYDACTIDTTSKVGKVLALRVLGCEDGLGGQGHCGRRDGSVKRGNLHVSFRGFQLWWELIETIVVEGVDTAVKVSVVVTMVVFKASGVSERSVLVAV